jgi:hypothetical protein
MFNLTILWFFFFFLEPHNRCHRYDITEARLAISDHSSEPELTNHLSLWKRTLEVFKRSSQVAEYGSNNFYFYFFSLLKHRKEGANF